MRYQRGEFFGCEAREYLLEKWRRKCAYRDAKDVSLEIDHIVPKSWDGPDRVSSLALSCRACNQAKGDRVIREFLVRDPKRLERILTWADAPLGDAAAVNSVCWVLYGRLKSMGLPVKTGTGGMTKWNWARLGIPKSHVLDAACVGSIGAVLDWHIPVLGMSCTGRGSRKHTR